ncbi:MAG: hypothetical protein LV468_00740 [Candidatus Nitrosotenuis sp.]|uniref:hypothetical protein n=1 Tax=Candidatus Nitrosotenuis cloacae TaxID=1603555 RepID=UPI002281FC06|nr:hypothetical protein [Candidatus Nitrosotenuis cloacae]MDC8437510.1 hypothetical protein [Candidatus Nitrosotenuis sp.]
MMQVKFDSDHMDRVHEEIYGLQKGNSPICIQLEKLDRYLREHGGKAFKPDTFDTFEYM